MRSKILTTFSIDLEVYNDLRKVLESNPMKYRNISNTANIMLATGLEDYKQGRKLVQFIDKLIK
jgi:hypothetical protein